MEGLRIENLKTLLTSVAQVLYKLRATSSRYCKKHGKSRIENFLANITDDRIAEISHTCKNIIFGSKFQHICYFSAF
jgi:hypothetical protein